MTFLGATIKSTIRLVLTNPKAGAAAFLIWAAVQGASGQDSGIAPVNTLLLGGALALLGWSLVTNVQQNKKLERIISALAGYEGTGGIINDVKELKKSRDESLKESGRVQGQIEEIRRQVGLPIKPRDLGDDT